MPDKKVMLSDHELGLAVESLKAIRQTVVSLIGANYLSRREKDILSEVRLDIETLADKLETIRNKED